MKIYDISMSVFHEMPVYKGKASKRPVLTVESDFTTGSAYETRLEMNMHTGTHLDAALHMLPDGYTIDALPLEKLVIKCKVFDFSQVEGKITAAEFAGKNVAAGDFIVLKTKNSYQQELLEGEYVYLDSTGAQYLADAKVTGVGIDALGVERAQPGHETHKVLLQDGIVIIEGLQLKAVPEGEYLLVAAPVAFKGVEAAPARVLLLKLDNPDEELVFVK